MDMLFLKKNLIRLTIFLMILKTMSHKESYWIVYELDSVWGSILIEKIVETHSTEDGAIEAVNTHSWQRGRPVTDYKIVEVL